MKKAKHSFKQRAISVGLSALMTLSMFQGVIPGSITAKADPNAISNDSLSVCRLGIWDKFQ